MFGQVRRMEEKSITKILRIQISKKNKWEEKGEAGCRI